MGGGIFKPQSDLKRLVAKYPLVSMVNDRVFLKNLKLRISSFSPYRAARRNIAVSYSGHMEDGVVNSISASVFEHFA